MRKSTLGVADEVMRLTVGATEKTLLNVSAVLALTLRYALVPVVFTAIGATVGAFAPAMGRLRAHVLHLAAGVVFAVVAVELLPEIQRRALVWNVVGGFGVGILSMLAVDRILERVRDGANNGEVTSDGPSGAAGWDGGAIVESPAPNTTSIHVALPLGLLGAVAIDFLLDGLLLGVGFAAGARIGILLALAEGAEQLSVGLALAGELRAAQLTRGRIVLVVSALGCLVFLTAIAGATVLSRLPDGPMESVLSFGAAALLYLVTDELLREAHREQETAGGTVMFFVGFLAFLIIGMKLD